MNRLKSIALQLLVAAAVVTSSCDDNEGAGEKYKMPGTIYVAGAANNTGVDNAVVWSDGISKGQGSYAGDTETASLYVTEDDNIYTVVNQHNGTEYSVYLLKNGVETYILANAESNICKATSVIVTDDREVIACGYREVSGERIPTFWRNGVEETTFAALKNAEAALVIEGNEGVYTVINKLDAALNPTSVLVYYNATYKYELQNGSYPTTATDAVFVDGKIYTLTNEVLSADKQGVRVWANGISSVSLSIDEVISVGNSLFVTANKDVIIGGYSQKADMTEGKQAKIWLGNFVQYNLNGGADDAEVKSITLFDNYLYSAGYTCNNNVYKPLVWMEAAEYSTLQDGGSNPTVNKLVIR